MLIGALAAIACLIAERDGFRDRLWRARVVFAGVFVSTPRGSASSQPFGVGRCSLPGSL